jgi:hypothetical protein
MPIQHLKIKYLPIPLVASPSSIPYHPFCQVSAFQVFFAGLPLSFFVPHQQRVELASLKPLAFAPGIRRNWKICRQDSDTSGRFQLPDLAGNTSYHFPVQIYRGPRP